VISGGKSPDASAREETSEDLERVGRLCTVWVHDDSFSRDEVILNISAFPVDSLKVGGLAAIVPIKSDVNVRDFQEEAQEASSDDAGGSKRRGPGSKAGSGLKTKRSNLAVQSHSKSDCGARWNGQEIDESKRYVFRVQDMSNEQRTKQPTLQISLASHLAQVFGFKNRTPVMISMVL
jgi:hypothetical protein